jgi:hypothetical protein
VDIIVESSAAAQKAAKRPGAQRVSYMEASGRGAVLDSAVNTGKNNPAQAGLGSAPDLASVSSLIVHRARSPAPLSSGRSTRSAQPARKGPLSGMRDVEPDQDLLSFAGTDAKSMASEALASYASRSSNIRGRI